MLIINPTDKAKPVARRGRKAAGLRDAETAGLPGKGQSGFFYFNLWIKCLETMPMNKKIKLIMMLFILGFVFSFPGAPPSWADSITYQFVATGTSSDYSSFTFRYLDVDADGRFSLDELVAGSFSGVTVYWTDYGYKSYDTMVAVPPCQDADGNQIANATVDLGWGFTPHQVPLFLGYDWYPSGWTYSQTPVSAVPIPPSSLLLGAGLIPLAWARRKKRLGK